MNKMKVRVCKANPWARVRGLVWRAWYRATRKQQRADALNEYRKTHRFTSFFDF